MLVHHPITNQPIRILRSEAQISKDNQTLVWVQPTYKPSSKWATRWSAVISDPAAWSCLSEELPIAILISSMEEAWIPILEAVREKEVLIFTSKDAAKQIEAKWSDMQVIQYDEMYDMYPFLGRRIQNESCLEQVVVGLAHILRVRRLAWTVDESSDAEYRFPKQVWEKQCKATCQNLPVEADADKVIPACWLIQQYFKHSLPKRSREVWTCLEKNLANPYIDKILLLNEQEYDLPVSEKLIVKRIESRLTYADVLCAIQTDLPVDSIAIFSNADIWFDTTLQPLWSLSLEERRLFLALLRWEDQQGQGKDPVLYGPHSDSQDTWIVAKNAVNFTVTDEEFRFPFGKPGCENAIPVAMLKHKFLVVNPAYTIRSYHLHASGIRNYDIKDTLYKPMYLHVDPTAIQPMGVEKDLKRFKDAIPEFIQVQWFKEQLQKQSFPRRVHGVTEEQVQTFCTMVNRNELQSLEPQGANLWTPSPEPSTLYRFFQPMFVTNQGLLSDMRSIYTGRYASWTNGWQEAQVSSLTPSIHVPFLVTVHTPDPACWSSLSSWVLQYLCHVLRIRNALKDAGRQILPDFAVPSIPSISAFLHDCVWNETRVITVPHMDHIQYYANEVWTVSPPAELNPTKEDIAVLRSIMPSAAPRNGVRRHRPVCVLCIEEDTPTTVCTRGWAEETLDCIFPTGFSGLRDRWDIRILTPTTEFPVIRKAMQDANWIVGHANNSLMDWIWMASPGTRVVEFQNEMSLQSKRLHLAGAADLFYIVGIVKKEPIEYQRQHALLDVGRLIKQYGFKELLEATVDADNLPVVVIPSGDGLKGVWSHSGDGFRELVQIWAERGYCRKEESEATHHCWWGGIGEVLLYDRPTPRWWVSPYPSYQMALFGNCLPPGPGNHGIRQSVWSFWPHSPKAVEAKADAGIKGWPDRSLKSIFLGKVENGVQKKQRCETDWSKAVELFSMPIDSTNAPYPYSQEEYLTHVGKARFGLCLPGYGSKCNREIEYLALGTVPILTEGIDMKSYLRAPKEGVHYFVAKTPEDVQKIVETTTQTQWEAMSTAGHQWWRENASAEGLFRLTWARIEQCRPFFHVGIPSQFMIPA